MAILFVYLPCQPVWLVTKSDLVYFQTPDEWEDLLEEKRRRKGGAHKRSSSVGNNGANDNLKEVWTVDTHVDYEQSGSFI